MPRNEFIGSGVLGLCDIISDPYPGHSVIPSICRATYDRRLLPGGQAQRPRRLGEAGVTFYVLRMKAIFEPSADKLAAETKSLPSYSTSPSDSPPDSTDRGTATSVFVGSPGGR